MKKINRIVVFSLLSLTLISSMACNSTKKWEKEEKRQIQEYLHSIGDTVYVLEPSGLYYLELLPGTGPMPVVNDTAIIYYKTTYLDGFVLFTNQGELIPYSFVVGYAPVLGLEEAIRYMKVGGKSKILTPSNLAYGSVGIPSFLSGYTPLLWEIQLLAVKPGSKK